MLVKLKLSYMDANGREVTNIRLVALHYFKDPYGFIFDFVAIFPYELFGAPIQDQAKRAAAVLYLRLPHVIRAIRIRWWFSDEEKRLNQKYMPQMYIAA